MREWNRKGYGAIALKIAVFAAHPDDETLGCGGTIARLAKEGHEIHVCIATIRHLEKECRQVCELLGVKKLWFTAYPDQQFETVYRSIQLTIETWIMNIQPDVVYTHHPGDLNLDHQIIAKSVCPKCNAKLHRSMANSGVWTCDRNQTLIGRINTTGKACAFQIRRMA